jgi:hypothetical protein
MFVITHSRKSITEVCIEQWKKAAIGWVEIK